MAVALYSPFFYPEPISTGRYNTYLARALVERGVQLDVITSHPLYPGWKPNRSNAGMDGVRIHRKGARMLYPKKDMLRRLALELWYTVHSVVITWKVRNRIDVAILVLPPVLFGVFVRFVLPRRVRVVGIVHDLQGLMVDSGVVGGAGLVGKTVLAVEGLLLKRLDKVICLSSSMSEMIASRLSVDVRRCEVCYPFAVAQDVEGGAQLQGLFEKGYYHVVYSGALGQKQIPTLLVSIFEKLSAIREDVVCHIFSAGPIYEDLKAQRPASAARRVRFHDLVNEDLLGELYERSDVQVIPQAFGAGAAAFPSKLPNLLLAGVPVFSICDESSELARVTRDCGGAVGQPDDFDEVVRRMVTFIDDCTAETHAARRAKFAHYAKGLFSVERIVDAVLLGY